MNKRAYVCHQLTFIHYLAMGVPMKNLQRFEWHSLKLLRHLLKDATIILQVTRFGISGDAENT